MQEETIVPIENTDGDDTVAAKASGSGKQAAKGSRGVNRTAAKDETQPGRRIKLRGISRP